MIVFLSDVTRISGFATGPESSEAADTTPKTARLGFAVVCAAMIRAWLFFSKAALGLG